MDWDRSDEKSIGESSSDYRHPHDSVSKFSIPHLFYTYNLVYTRIDTKIVFIFSNLLLTQCNFPNNFQTKKKSICMTFLSH